MPIKKKHILVAIFSSLIISVVLMATFAGYMLYIQWKKDSFALDYRNSIYKLTAELFKSDVLIKNVSLRMKQKEPFSGKPLFEGTIKNNTDKTITSLLVEVYIQEPDGNVIYRRWFYPLGEEPYGDPSVFFGTQPKKNILSPGEEISFAYPLLNCPKKVISEVSRKSRFAKRDSYGNLTLTCSVVGLDVI
ncbi:MAG: hypothetical protein GF409_01795 [Candidatus Omnitrophica bacterium]|nr:hypothetical protein [Candidatus Omnitrophota bacterium]